jgi:hypothetical protein
MHCRGIVPAVVAGLLVFATLSHADWVRLLEDDFSSAAAWTYEGATNAASQPLARINTSSGLVEAEWDQSNYADYGGDPYVLIPSRLMRSLPRPLTDRDTFRVGAVLRIEPGSVPDTTEFYQIANLGLYDPQQMGPDRAMDDNRSGNSTLLRDGSDFVEFNYWINNRSWGFNPSVGAVIGAHIEGLDGDYWTGSSFEPMWHSTDMGADHWLPEGTSLYVEVVYYGAAAGPIARRAYAAVYSDAARTSILTVNGTELFYWTLPLPTDRTFRVTHVGFYNYVARNWGGVHGAGRGAWDDLFVEQAEADFNAAAMADGPAWSFAAVSGEVYRIESCADLAAGAWTPLAVVTAQSDRVSFGLSDIVARAQWLRVVK